MTSRSVRILDRLVAANPEALTLDGMEEALVGLGGPFNHVLAIYDRAVLVVILRHGGLTEDEALEYIDFNISGAYVGKHTPIIAEFFTINENAL
jgi:hypothetical protein